MIQYYSLLLHLCLTYIVACRATPSLLCISNNGQWFPTAHTHTTLEALGIYSPMIIHAHYQYRHYVPRHNGPVACQHEAQSSTVLKYIERIVDNMARRSTNHTRNTSIVICGLPMAPEAVRNEIRPLRTRQFPVIIVNSSCRSGTLMLGVKDPRVVSEKAPC